VFSCFLFINAYAQNDQQAKGIHFETGLNWLQIRQKAFQEHKYIFVDCYASWCGPCKLMDQQTYPKQTVGDFVNSRFIAVRLQLDTSAKDGDDIKARYADAHLVKTTYPVPAFPTFLFFSPEGKLVHEGIGFLREAEFLTLLKDALNPEKQYYTLLAAFDSNKDYTKVPLIIEAADVIKDEPTVRRLTQAFFDEYLPTLSEKQFTTKENLLMLGNSPGRIQSDSPVFQWILHHPAETDTIVSARESSYANQIIDMVIDREDISAKLWKDPQKGIPYTKNPDWKLISLNIENKYGKSRADNLVSNEQFGFYQRLKDWNNYAKCVEEAIQTHPPQIAHKAFSQAVGGMAVNPFSPADDAWGLNDVCWTLFEGCKDKAILSRAEQWSDLSTRLVDPKDTAHVAMYNDTKANLLYKLGRTSEAMEAEKKAIDLSILKKSDADIKDFTATLEKMKKRIPTWPVSK